MPLFKTLVMQIFPEIMQPYLHLLHEWKIEKVLCNYFTNVNICWVRPLVSNHHTFDSAIAEKSLGKFQGIRNAFLFLRNEAGMKVKFFKRNEAGTERQKLRNEKRNDFVPFSVPFKRKIHITFIKLQFSSWKMMKISFQHVALKDSS